MAGKKTKSPSSLIDVITSTYRTLRQESEELMSTAGLTRAQFHALRCAAEGPLPMKEISERMFVTRADVTGLVDKLESKGLVRRVAHHRDRRTTLVELTPKGKKVQERISSKYKAFMQDSLKALTRAEQDSLYDALVKLQDKMSQAET
jgi:MarR family transcriptional regulator, 2-MHQ and catechol-resistance regulon repressor